MFDLIFGRKLRRMISESRRGSLLKLRELVPTRRNRLEGEIRRRTQFAYLGDHVGLCRVLGRFKMYVDTRDIGLSSHLALDGYWELWVTEFLTEHLRRGMKCVDVGANLGYFTLVMAEMVGEEGVVHAFEPNPPIAAMLRSSVHVNGFLDRVRIHAAALSSTNDGRFRLHVPENYPGGAALVEVGEHEEASVEVRRLDSLAELADADVIKIDAEGGELEIWRGMSALLASGRPLVVLMEIVLDRYPDPAGFLDEIADAGFAMHFIGGAQPLRPITREEVLRWPKTQDGMLVLIR